MRSTAISLFSGAGGCSLGFQRAGFDVLLAVEKDDNAAQTYRENFPKTKLLHQDITTLDAKEVLLQIGLKPTELTFLIGGPPCQGFSSAGTRFLDDPRNKLVKHYLRFLESIQPRWFLMENVEGLLTTGKGEYFPKLAESFLKIGYSIQIHKIYSHWYGLPQKRKRVFIIGNRFGLDFSMPSFTHFEGESIFNENPVLTIMDAVSDLPTPATMRDSKLAYEKPPLNGFQRHLRGDLVTEHWTPKLESNILEKISLLAAGQTMRNLPEHLHHPSYRRRAFRRVMDGTPTEKRGGAPSGVKRLLASEPCLTITSAAPRELVHPTENRFLTLRECARLQSFPDSFTFYGSVQSKIRQIGNAIPPLVAQKLAEHLLQQDSAVSEPSSGRGRLLNFSLTKATAMSPALNRVDYLLRTLQDGGTIESNNRLGEEHAFSGAALATQ